jgi:hypothetical protein
LRQDTQYQQPQAPQTDGKSVQHLPQQEIQKTGLSVKASRSTNNDTLKVVTVFDFSEAVSENDRIMVITKMILNETKWLLEFIGRPKS